VRSAAPSASFVEFPDSTSVDHALPFVTDRELSANVTRRQAIAERLVGLQTDIRNVTFEVYDSTVILGGSVRSRQERLKIVSCVSRVPGVTRVIDSLALRDDSPSTHVYAAKGNSQLRRLTAAYLHIDPRLPELADTSPDRLARSAPMELVGKLRGAITKKYSSARKLFMSWMR
jgi:hypothetical protein